MVAMPHCLTDNSNPTEAQRKQSFFCTKALALRATLKEGHRAMRHLFWYNRQKGDSVDSHYPHGIISVISVSLWEISHREALGLPRTVLRRIPLFPFNFLLFTVEVVFYDSPYKSFAIY